MVENPGQRNLNAGPDFINAQLRIGDVKWFGNVEIHVKSSDWYLHGHENDKNYQNLILHVVYNHDLEDLPHDCPLVVLKGHIPEKIRNQFSELQQPFAFIPCENMFDEVDEFTRDNFVESLYIARLEKSLTSLESRLQILNSNWEALLFERLAYVFGLKINATAFEILAKSFPFRMIQQLQRKDENIEALLFGQAGFLNDPQDLYQKELQVEYTFLRNKYELKPIDNHLFKFLRLRPPNFPTIRIAQLAAIYQAENQLFQELIKVKSLNDLKQKFDQIQTSKYWEDHYNFGKVSKKETKNISKDRLQLLMLNALIPIKYLYQRNQGNSSVEEILEMVETIKPEKNSILNKFKQIGAKISSAKESQAYLELKKSFCDEKKCLHCMIGNNIIKNAG